MSNRKQSILENKFINIDAEDINAVVAALDDRQLAGTAEIVQQYEYELSKHFGVKHALAVASGTAALHLLMYLFDISTDDEVIVPPTAPIMSVLPILAVGAKPVFADVSPDSFSFDIADVERKITNRTKAIVSVPMWGYPTKIDDLRSVARSNRIVLIEDASHCHGAIQAGSLVGTNGDVGFFSTQERKLVATGEGGFIVTNNDNVADRVREIRDFGKPFRITRELKDHLGQYGYLFGLNFRIAAMSAALGISQLKKLDTKIRARTHNSEVLKQDLLKMEWLQELGVMPGNTPNYYSLVLFVDPATMAAEDLAKYLYDRGIISDTYRFGIRPLYELPILSPFATECPNATQILQRIITLPVHEGLTPEDRSRIVKNIKQAKEVLCN